VNMAAESTFPTMTELDKSIRFDLPVDKDNKATEVRVATGRAPLARHRHRFLGSVGVDLAGKSDLQTSFWQVCHNYPF
jgi:hypothetical protein